MTANPDMFQHPDLPGDEDGQPDQREEGQQDERLFAGKYKSVEELEKGYMNLQSIENRNHERLTALEQRMLESAPDDRILPSERREARPRPEEVLSELGIPPEALGEFVQQQLHVALNPLIQGNQARETLRKNYQNFDSLEEEVAKFLTSSPELQSRYQRMFRVDQGGAMEWAINRYLSTQKQATPPRESASGADAAAARLDAMLPKGQSASNRATNVQQMQDAERLQAAYDYGQQSGNWQPYMDMRIKGVIPDSHTEKKLG